MPGRPALAAALLFAMLAAHAQARSDDGEPVEAVWRVQTVQFEYRGESTSYSCGSLRRRVRAILIRMGAHEDTVVRAQACYDLSGLARLQINMATPVPATPENLKALSEHDSRDELIARLRGEALKSSADLVRFPAEWRRISLARDKTLKLEPGDCELVEQLRDEILPLMAVRVVKDNLRCSAVFGTYTRPQLTVEALVPAQPDRVAMAF